MSVEMQSKFEVSNTASRAWALVSGVKTPFVLAALVIAVLEIVVKVLQDLFVSMAGEGVAVIIGVILTFVLIFPAYVGTMFMGLQRVRGLPVLVSQVFTFYRSERLMQIFLLYFIFYVVTFLTSIIVALFSMVPIVNLIVIVADIALLLFLAARVSLSIYLVFDKNKSAIEAIKLSYKMTAGYTVSMLLAILLCIVATFLGVITLFIGLIWAIPFVHIFFAMIYQSIAEEKIAMVA